MLFSTSVLARLPLATFGIGLLVHAHHLTGSYAAAGAVAGALAVAQGAGGPLLGRLVDRRGQTTVLLASALVAGGALFAAAALPVGTALLPLLLLAAVIGFATPPVGACMRTLIPSRFPVLKSQRRAYAADATATELTWVAGPPLALSLGALAGTGAALAFAAVVLVVATGLFALAPASRAWRPGPRVAAGQGALSSPAMRVLVVVLVAVGVVFGATEVGVAAAAGSSAGLLLGLWGVGSLAGGVVVTRLGGGAAAGRGFVLLLAGLGAGHLALVAGSLGTVAFAVLITLAGSMIAPILASAYGMVDHAAPEGTATEAFSWLATATAVGSALGAAAGGALIDAVSPAAAFILAGAAGLLAAATALTRIPARRPDPVGRPVPLAIGRGQDVDQGAAGVRAALLADQPAG
ncbi:MFS transporter [Actinoplanes sp. NPDC051470]|uniref:MFS transporter n=1 Tax=Actinoplanes sp. NPDC051470 TaxID=3157224 RepID=UPI00343FB0AF